MGARNTAHSRHSKTRVAQLVIMEGHRKSTKCFRCSSGRTRRMFARLVDSAGRGEPVQETEELLRARHSPRTQTPSGRNQDPNSPRHDHGCRADISLTSRRKPAYSDWLLSGETDQYCRTPTSVPAPQAAGAGSPCGAGRGTYLQTPIRVQTGGSGDYGYIPAFRR
ncbi:hypothetical protein H8959_015383 [Pygathrix nigripes]